MDDPLEADMGFFTGYTTHEISYKKPTGVLPAAVVWAHTERRGECLKCSVHIQAGEINCDLYVN